MPTLAEFVASNPAISSALLGGLVGAPVGAAFSEKGVQSRGAIQGALLGAGLGAIGGPTLHALQTIQPSPEKALAIGAITGGGIGGALGRRRLSPWVMEHLKALAQSEAEDVQERKRTRREAREERARARSVKAGSYDDEARERTTAFDYGMELLINRLGLEKESFSKAAGCDANTLADRTIEWLTNQIEEVGAEAP